MRVLPRPLATVMLTISLLPFLATRAAAIPENNGFGGSNDHASALIAWLRSKGGFVSDKITIRRLDPNDASSPMGVFATDAIHVNETVLTVPRKCYLGLQPEDIINTDLFYSDEVTMEQIMEVYYANACRLTQRLIQEQQKWKAAPEESDFAPYMAYLETQPMGMLPATYSENGKKLLRKIQGINTVASLKDSNHSVPPLLLVDWIEDQFVKTQCIPGDQPEFVHAVELAIQRGYDTELIPIWDMFNHHNGMLNVATNSLHSDEGLKVWASKEIVAGQELFATYNYCTDCYDVGDDWGTPGIYRDFGFVEELPHVWPFPDHDILYTVVLEEETGRIRAAFAYKNPNTGETEGIPDAEGLKFLRDELSRVAALDLEKELEGELPPHEWEMIVKFHRYLLIALTAGIEATLEEMHYEHGEARDEF